MIDSHCEAVCADSPPEYQPLWPSKAALRLGPFMSHFTKKSGVCDHTVPLPPCSPSFTASISFLHSFAFFAVQLLGDEDRMKKQGLLSVVAVIHVT